MEIKRTTEISVEKPRRFIIRLPENDEKIVCPTCGETMLTAEASAVLFRVKCRLVYQIIEADAAHFVEPETGAMFVCPTSLDRAIGDVNDTPIAQIVNLLMDSAAEDSKNRNNDERQKLLWKIK